MSVAETTPHVKKPFSAPRSPALETRLAGVRQAEIVRRRRTGACLLAAVVFWLLAAIALADYYLVLPAVLRAAALLGVAAAGAVIFRDVARRLRYDESDAAADVEAAYPDYGQRVRTAWDYTALIETTAPAAPPLVESLRADTERRIQTADFSQVVSNRPFRQAAGVLAFLGFLSLLCLLFVPEARIAAGRTLLLPLHYTTVTVAPIPEKVRRGEDVTIEAEVHGRPLASAQVLYRPAQSETAWTRLALLPPEADPEAPPEELTGQLSARLKALEQDIEFQVIAGPRDHPPGRIVVLQPLTLEKFSAEIEPPAYTGLKPQTVESEDMKAPEGSRVALRFTLNRAPAEAQLVAATTGGKPTDAAENPLTSAAVKIEGEAIQVELPDLRQSVQFYLAAKAADGIALDSPRYRIRVTPDKKPAIRFLSPPEELEVIPTTEVTMAVEAEDDYGVSKMGVAVKVGDGPMQTLWEQAPGEASPSVRGAPVLALEDYELTFQDAVTYYAFAEDNYFGQPRRATTELRFIDIRPFQREYEILPSPGGT